MRVPTEIRDTVLGILKISAILLMGPLFGLLVASIVWLFSLSPDPAGASGDPSDGGLLVLGALSGLLISIPACAAVSIRVWEISVARKSETPQRAHGRALKHEAGTRGHPSSLLEEIKSALKFLKIRVG